ncbi:FecR domain-containing protein [Pseudomonas sp. Gutcm_11s]|uniref:FecR domain-containing protein n=1 Tax=Pseudomonas sp. Gutcm_11s TaxID=3026088 RepID=UPI002361DC76|nr:FecR domain-containing protein [Pseudomonas sp. Gutcm_11s]MDD0844755.1 FecR domain-containing protein [Pseudomonas sp. Gutcm_11s]
MESRGYERDLPSHAVLEQAAHWYATLRDGQASAQQHAHWQAWLGADLMHEQAWRYVEGIGRDFEPLRGRPDARLAADALDVAAGRMHSRRRLLTGMAVITTGSLCGWLGWREALLPSNLMAWGADQRTATGEQREMTLADGSQAWLNTASAIDLAFSSRARVVRLVRGEVFISTAKGARPFYVETEHGRLQALGTRFNVRRDGERTWLAVYEGAVEIRTASGATRVVGAGQQAHFDAGHIGDSQAADAAREAWTQGTLLADNISLREVVQELSRYRHGHLGVADEVADLRVYGNFPVQDSERVLRMLASALPIRIEQPMPWWASIEARH